MLSACIFAAPLRAEECALVESRSSLASLSGVRIASLEIQSESPYVPGLPRMMGALHANSREGVIRRQLLFAAGDTVDTLLVGETMRRLRAQRLFQDAVLLARRCEPSGAIALVLRSRDTWTLKPTARLRQPSQLSVGVEDRNFLGTARTVAITREMTLNGSGGAFTFVDPFILGSSVAGHLRVAKLAGSETFKLGVRRHEYSVFDRWRVEGNVSRLGYRDTTAVDKGLHTVSAMALVGRRIGSTGHHVTSVLLGAEFDSAANISPSRRNVAAGMPHARSFLGLDFGLQRRTAQFDTATWIAPGRGFLDVPVGWEGEGLVAAGHERDANSAAFKIDAWLGRVWLPRRGQILMADWWTSGYLGRGIDNNHTARASLSFYSEAARGMWGARLTMEQLHEVDPDRRGLSLMPLADYTTPVVRTFAAHGRQAIAASVDRDLRLARIGAASVINAGGFLAGSYRWGVHGYDGRPLHAAVIGTRLRVLSANGTVGSVRVDVGYPVLRSDILASKPYVTVTYGTLFDASRMRDGRRVY